MSWRTRATYILNRSDMMTFLDINSFGWGGPQKNHNEEGNSKYFQIAIIYIPSFEIEARDTALWSTYKYVIVSFIFWVERCVNLFIFM